MIGKYREREQSLMTRLVNVVRYEENGYYHLSKSGFYCKCGADLNPHHAARVDEWTAESNGYTPCPDCFDDR